MSKSRIVHCLLCFALLAGGGAGLIGNQAVVIAQEEPPLEEKLELNTMYPVLRGESGEIFEFEVEVKYQGSERRRFELATTVPPEWRAAIMAGYDGKEITAIELEPGKAYPDKVKVIFGPLFWKQPEPGDYVVTLKAGSGDIKGAIDLKAVVTARYGLDVSTGTGRLNTEVDAGKDNHFSILLENTGSAALENVTFSSSKPEGWSITFNPQKVESLEPGLTQEVDIVIKPPDKTIAGDYAITLWTESKEASKKLELRITVLTPTIWGWVGVLIVLAVIAGLAVIFRQLGRR